MGTGRALLVLGRISNLPTVWSNCLVALAVSGAVAMEWILVLPAATLLYLGGMYLNDAFDADHDRRWRRERPIPSGAIPVGTVRMLAGLQLVLGAFLLVLPVLLSDNRPGLPLLLVLLLLCSIVVYNRYHKGYAWSPWIMALCRFLLFLSVAASTGQGLGGTAGGTALWNAFSLFAYVAGLSFIARRESRGTFVHWWPVLLLVFPVFWAFFVSNGIHAWSGRATILAYLVWTGMSLSELYGNRRPDPGRAVSHLLAGIVLVDLMALGLGNMVLTAVLAACFCLALLLQRTIPAT